MSDDPPLKNKVCFGIDLKDYEIPERGVINLTWLIEMYKVFPEKAHFFTSYFTKLVGGKQLQKQIEEGKTEQEIKASWEPRLSQYKVMRKKYLLYQ